MTCGTSVSTLWETSQWVPKHFAFSWLAERDLGLRIRTFSRSLLQSATVLLQQVRIITEPLQIKEIYCWWGWCQASCGVFDSMQNDLQLPIHTTFWNLLYEKKNYRLFPEMQCVKLFSLITSVHYFVSACQKLKKSWDGDICVLYQMTF